MVIVSDVIFWLREVSCAYHVAELGRTPCKDEDDIAALAALEVVLRAATELTLAQSDFNWACGSQAGKKGGGKGVLHGC